MPYLGKQPAASALVVESGSIQSAEIEDGTIEDSDISSNFKGLLSGSAVANASSVTAASISGSITSTGSFGSLSVADSVQGNLTLGGNLVSAGELTIDAETDIVFDANGADIKLKDDGTEFGRISRVSSDLVIKSISNNNDILFKGVDASSTITALSLDMSEAGNAEFSGNVSGSLVSTASFGSVNATHLNGVFEGTLGSVANALISGSTVVNAPNISGSITSTGSFGSLVVVDKVQGNLDLGGNITAAGDISTSGSIFAREFHTEFTSASVIFASGSNKFGDDSGDTHRFTGSMLVSGSITMADGDLTVTDNLDVSGNVTGSITSTGSFGSIVTGGTLTLSDSLDMQDNNKILLGTGDDLEIFFDGTNSIFDHTPGGGQMFIRSDQIAFDDSQGTPKNYATFYQGTGVVFNEDSEDQDFRVESNGATHALFIEGGNSRVGIGDASPGSPLDVKSSEAANTANFNSTNGATNITFESNGSLIGQMEFSGPGPSQIVTRTTASLAFGSNNVKTLYITDDKKVSIDSGGNNASTTANAYADNLVIRGSNDGDGSGITIFSETDEFGTLYFGDGGTGNQAYRGYVQYSHAADTLQLGAAGSTRMVIDSSGSIGINDTNVISNSGFGHPFVSLQGATFPAYIIKNSAGGAEGLMANPSGSGLQLAIAGNGIAADNHIRFRTGNSNSNYNSTERMRITSEGNVGIGTTAPTAFYPCLQVEGTQAAIIINDNNSDAFATMIADGGNFNIYFDHSGAIRFLDATNNGGSSGNVEFVFNNNGSAEKAGGAGDWAGISDIRVKKNIEDLSIDALNVLNTLRPVEFNWKEEEIHNTPKDSEGKTYGFIADEIESIMPQLITTSGVDKDSADREYLDEDGMAKKTELGIMASLYIKAIQQLTEKVESQQKQIEELKEGQNG